MCNLLKKSSWGNPKGYGGGKSGEGESQGTMVAKAKSISAWSQGKFWGEINILGKGAGLSQSCQVSLWLREEEGPKS